MRMEVSCLGKHSFLCLDGVYGWGEGEQGSRMTVMCLGCSTEWVVVGEGGRGKREHIWTH